MIFDTKLLLVQKYVNMIFRKVGRGSYLILKKKLVSNQSVVLITNEVSINNKQAHCNNLDICYSFGFYLIGMPVIYYNFVLGLVIITTTYIFYST